MANSTPETRDVVIAIPQEGFAGSGLLNPLARVSRILITKSSSTGKPLAGNATSSETTFAIRLEPGKSVTAAFEGNQPLPDAVLWTALDFEQRQSRFDSLRGALIGSISLLTLTIIGLAIIRKRKAAVASAIFATTALLFVSLEMGVLNGAVLALASIGASAGMVRAAIETLFTTGLIVALMGFSGANRTTRILTGGLCLGLVLTLANLALAYFEPALAISFARIGFLFFVIQGFLILLRAQKVSQNPVKGAILFWSALTAWAFLAVVVVFSKGRPRRQPCC